MSLARMFLSGFLVAGGIILAAFTLHGYLDPDWQRKQVESATARDMEAAKARERATEASASTFQPKERLMVGRTEPAAPEPRPPAAKPAPKPDPAATAEAKPASKPAAPKKKAADKPADKAPPPQQASFSWQKLFGGN